MTNTRDVNLSLEKRKSVAGSIANYFSDLFQNMRKHPLIYLLAIPVVAYYVIFQYFPMYGATIAFRDFFPGRTIMASPWVGMAHFIEFFNGPYAFRVIRNTFMINFLQLIFVFPAPIILALMMNEIYRINFKRTVQTIVYMPHFISLIVICGMILDFTSRNGLVNDIIYFFGGTRQNIMVNPSLFWPVHIVSDIWQTAGWGTIIYLAALAGVNQELYEAARVDGAGRWRQTIHITIPGILPTLVIMLILRLGSMMHVGFEKIILLYNPLIYETADVISSYVYRRGLLQFNFSFSAAVGLFSSVINFTLLCIANFISRRVNDTSLW